MMGYFETLIFHGKYEDTLILHSMYSLGLEPYNLCLLKFESIQNNKTIMLYDHRTKSNISLKLTDILYQDLMFLKRFKDLQNKNSSNEERYSVDGTKINGPFIFSVKATGIFNKFERKFGGILQNFNITPRDLVRLSKFMNKTSKMELYP